MVWNESTSQYETFTLLKRLVIKAFKESCNSFIKFWQGKEGSVTQLRQYPTFNHLNSGLNLALVFGFSDPCRDNSHRVMFSQILIGGVDHRLIAMG